MFSFKCETFVLLAACAWVSELLLWFELETVSSQALKYDVVYFCQNIEAILFKIW